jgi:hypothetical protein
MTVELAKMTDTAICRPHISRQRKTGPELYNSGAGEHDRHRNLQGLGHSGWLQDCY